MMPIFISEIPCSREASVHHLRIMRNQMYLFWRDPGTLMTLPLRPRAHPEVGWFGMVGGRGMLTVCREYTAVLLCEISLLQRSYVDNLWPPRAAYGRPGHARARRCFQKNQFKCWKTLGFCDIQNQSESFVIKAVSAATLILKVSSSAKASKVFHARPMIHNQMLSLNKFMM